MLDETASSNPTPLPDIDALMAPTQEELSRTHAVASIHRHAMMNLRFDLRESYEVAVLPEFKRVHGRDPENGQEVEKAIKTDGFFRFYSAIRYNAQEMGPQAWQPAVQRALKDMIDVARQAAEQAPSGGSLRLDPNFEVPRYVTQLDVHLAPGCYHSEFTQDDVSQGVLLGRGIKGNNRLKIFGGVGASISCWLKHRYPDFSPRRVLDMATQSGANVLAYPKAFAACEAYGIDVAAPGLRYGHAKAEFEGVPIHFSQQNAEGTDFADGFFDLVVSSFFLHEVPLASTKRILKEAYRLLAPGGILAFLELPPAKACDPFLNFSLDWDTKYNNEPFYATYRAQDPVQLVVEAGFPKEAAFEVTIPDVPNYDMRNYPKFLAGELEAPPHGGGGWYIFGARKS